MNTFVIVLLIKNIPDDDYNGDVLKKCISFNLIINIAITL